MFTVAKQDPPHPKKNIKKFCRGRLQSYPLDTFLVMKHFTNIKNNLWSLHENVYINIDNAHTIKIYYYHI